MITRALLLSAVAVSAIGLAACPAPQSTETAATTEATATESSTTTSGQMGSTATAGTAANPTVGGAEMPATRNIVENAAASPIHRTLVAAVTQAQLAETLSGAGPFTVFAPTDAAFEKVPAATRTSLMEDANRQQLAGILTYHVVPGRITAADLTRLITEGGGSATLTTVQGGTLTARAANGGVTLTDAAGGTSRVETADVMQSNGVIHVVDTVLMPQA